MADNKKQIDVYCPECLALYNRKKLLFQRDPEAKGSITIVCRGCKTKQTIKFDKE